MYSIWLFLRCTVCIRMLFTVSQLHIHINLFLIFTCLVRIRIAFAYRCGHGLTTISDQLRPCLVHTFAVMSSRSRTPHCTTLVWYSTVQLHSCWSVFLALHELPKKKIQNILETHEEIHKNFRRKCWDRKEKTKSVFKIEMKKQCNFLASLRFIISSGGSRKTFRGREDARTTKILVYNQRIPHNSIAKFA